MAEKQTLAGRGRKECPSCHKIVGARTAQCACGHNFEPKRKAPQGWQDAAIPDLIAELQKRVTALEEFKKGYKTWADARKQIQKVLDLLDALGGAEAVFAGIDYIEEKT